MRVTFEPEIDMAYIYLTDPDEARKVAQTEPLVVDLTSGSRRLINLDFDAAGRLIGIEIDGAVGAVPQSLLAAAEKPRRATRDR
jgi:uncharacterized protein YuzE